MATEKQILSRQRNWNKARLMGFIFAGESFRGSFTTEEQKTLDEINTLRVKLLDEWDQNSVKLGFKVEPKKDKRYEKK